MSHRTSVCVACLSVACGAAGLARAGLVVGGLAGSATSGGGDGPRGDVLYDTLRFADESLYESANGNAYSGLGWFGMLFDNQLCDDFTTDDRCIITQVTNDSLCFLGRTPAGGVQVDVYAIVDGRPPEDPLYSATVPVTEASSWFDPYYGLIGIRLTADVHIPLEPNTSYSLMVQAVDLTRDGDWYYQIFDNDSRIGGDRFLRDGGRANEGWPQVWTSAGSVGFGVGDIGMRIRAVPGAPGLVLILAAGLAGRRR